MKIKGQGHDMIQDIMEEKKPKISVVCPAYNAEHTIANAINSILNQTFQDWELIIIGDGGENWQNREKIVKSFNDPRIIYQQQSHQGLVAARNAGCRLAKAEIIAVQDADDLSMPDRLEKSYQLITDHDADIVYHGWYVNMWDIKFNCIGRKYFPVRADKDYKIQDEILKSQCLPAWPIFRKWVWEQKPFRMKTQYAYDWMMWLDWLYGLQIKMVGINTGLYEYVRHENSASIRFEKEGLRQQSFQKIKEIMREEYGQTIDISDDAGLQPQPSG